MNKNKFLPFIIGIATIFITVLVVVAQNSNKEEVSVANLEESVNSVVPVTESPTVSNKPTTTPTKTNPNEYTLATVAQHSSASSCWTAVNGSVYNVTSWISAHPGGSSTIKSMCGIDASSAFDNQHSGQRRPESELTSFKIGTLIK